jgi:acetylornithine deacetylase
MTDAELLALHRELVAIPSLSHQEQALCAYLESRLRSLGVQVERFGDNLFMSHGSGPVLCFNSHFDTVPAAAGWTRPPHEVVVEQGRVYGLGANDAKASVAAMVAAFLRLKARPLGVKLVLTLVCEEETGGKGAEVLVPELARRGLAAEAVVVGEPTGLDVAVAQKGLLVLELRETGRACHAAHGQALGAKNALRALARDLVALEGVDLGPVHPELGPVTLEPTVAKGGSARNSIPAEASCILDVRTNPTPSHADMVERLRAAVKGELVVLSDRLRPTEISESHPLVRAAQAARPEAKLFGSRGLSDLVFFSPTPAIKVGPGQTERSHAPDEFVLENELLAGARFYEQLVLAYAASRSRS